MKQEIIQGDCLNANKKILKVKKMKTIIDKHTAGKRLSHIYSILNKNKNMLNTSITYDGVEYVGVLTAVDN